MSSKMALVVVLIAIVIGSTEALKVGPGQPRGDEIHRAEMIFQNANSLYKSGKLQEAVSKYRESLNLHPNNADTYTNLGSALLDLEKTEDAIEAYEQALGLDPSSADAAYNLGLVYHDSGDERRAIELYKQCLRTSQERIDAWMNLASCFHAIGDMDKSIFAYNKVLEKMSLTGGDDDDEVKSKVHEYLGRALLRKRDNMKVNGQLDEGAYKKTTFDANRHLEIAISLDSSNDIAKHMLASNSLESNTVTAPQEYVKTLFDDYSDNFESSLANLDYRVPQYIAAEIASIRKTGLGRDWEAVVDLGCGTGLLVPLLDLPSTNLVMGVDLSPKMLDIAAEKGVYDILSAGDIVDFLEDMATFRDMGPKDENTIEWIETAPESAKQSLKAKLEKRDAILFAAADVLVYIGELRRLFSALRRVMTIGDAFVFTVENADRSPDKSELSLKAGWLLQSTGRYAHHLAYVERLAAEMSMEVSLVRNVVPRKELNEDIQGYLCIVYRI